MKAVILAGGKGTRMGEMTMEIPKPMLTIGGQPVLEHQVELLRKYNITDITILVNYLKDSIIDHFGNGEQFGVQINYFEEKEPLGTTGGIKAIEDQLQEDFIVFYGDVMIDMHLGRLINFHKEKQSECTLVLHPNDHPFDSDLVETDEQHQVIKFLPKPHPEGVYYKNLVNAGAYILTPGIFRFIDKDKKADFGRQIFPLIYNKIKMFGYNTAEYLKDMGTPDRLEEVEKAYLSGKIRRSNYEHKQKAIFMDRDGVINVEKSFINKPEDYEVYDFTPEAVKKINQTDYKAIVVTNQSAIARNISTFEELATIHKKMETIMGNAGAKIDELYFCPHHPDNGYPEERVEYKIECECRKPKPGMLLKAARDFNIDLSQSIIIGDTERDLKAGKAAGCYTAGVMTGYGVKTTSLLPDFFFADLLDAITFLTDEQNESTFISMEKLFQKSNKPFILGIGGNARSGKSNLAAFLKMRFEQSGQKVLKVEMDNWILPEEKRNSKMDVYQRFNMNKLETDVQSLLNNNSIEVSTYSNHPERISQLVKYDCKNCDIIILEGVVALSSEKLRNLYTHKVFVTTAEEKRLTRIKKYYQWRGKSESETQALYESRKIDEYKLIEKDSKLADQIISN
jgi:D,D-heptose 1,7-bisphosphate phosphatase